MPRAWRSLISAATSLPLKVIEKSITYLTQVDSGRFPRLEFGQGVRNLQGSVSYTASDNQSQRAKAGRLFTLRPPALESPFQR